MLCFVPEGSQKKYQIMEYYPTLRTLIFASFANLMRIRENKFLRNFRK